MTASQPMSNQIGSIALQQASQIVALFVCLFVCLFVVPPNHNLKLKGTT
jgi:hypothetical protein